MLIPNVLSLLETRQRWKKEIKSKRRKKPNRLYRTHGTLGSPTNERTYGRMDGQIKKQKRNDWPPTLYIYIE